MQRILKYQALHTQWHNFEGLCQVVSRTLYSQTGKWEKTFNTKVRKDLENYWRDHVVKTDSRPTTQLEGQEKYYVLSMFPYPSGKLHMGHVRVYTISDTMARYHRLSGKQVIHPMGWDAFGLPAENAAIERGQRPDKWTDSNIDNMRQQLDLLCCSFDWDREYATCDPEYYRWTQWIFLKMYEAGLVYQKEAQVNWDPVDQTVLADEQIDENGCSWRSGAKAEKKYLKQWYIRTTSYAKSLYDGLSDVDPDMWRDIILLQKHWIGECDGCRVHFKIQSPEGGIDCDESIFTRHAGGLFGASHVLISEDHQLNIQKYYMPDQDPSSTDILLTLRALNPVNEQKLPVFVTKRDIGEHQQIHLGVPSFNSQDQEFAEQHGIHIEQVLESRPDGENVLVNSGEFSGLTPTEAFKEISSWLKKNNHGGYITSEKLKDWLISRQRYWGTPIPVIHCPKKGLVPVPYEDLPVKLPQVSKLTGKGESPLAQDQEWLKVKCQGCDCGGYGRRETDTMDTFVDSSWYYLRYVDPRNTQLPFSPELANKLMPVDLYIGGKEHAIMHLYYARFFNHFLNDQGMLGHREPFINLLTQGMVMGQSFKVKDTGKYLKPDEVDFSGKRPVEKDSGAALEVKWEKMSKSKHNGVDPQDVLEEFGVDATRLCILSNVAPKSNRNWSHDVFKGVLRWQGRIWNLVTQLKDLRSASDQPCQLSPDELRKEEEFIFEKRNFFLKEVTFNCEKMFLLNVAISRLQALTTDLKKVSPEAMRCSPLFEQGLSDLVIMMAPFAPLFACELWEGLQSIRNKKTTYKWTAECHDPWVTCFCLPWMIDQDVLAQDWPKVDPAFKLTLAAKVNHKDVARVRLTREEFNMLNKSKAMDLIQNIPEFRETYKNEQMSSMFYFVPDFKAEMNFELKTKKKNKEN